MGNACRRQGNAAKRGCEPEPEPGPGPKASQIVYMKWHPILELRCYHYPVAAFFSSVEKLSNFKFRSRNQVSLPIAPHCRIAVVLIEILNGDQPRPKSPPFPEQYRAAEQAPCPDPATIPRVHLHRDPVDPNLCIGCQCQCQIRPAKSFFQNRPQNRSLLLFIVPLLFSKAKASQPSTLSV